jgi:AcrR family transcriptional regulator
MDIAPGVPRGRRLDPDERRAHILEVARRLFAERPYSSVTTRDVAEASGVARSLVHHYFGGIAEVFLAVVAQGGVALADVRQAGTETPFGPRVTRNVAASLDVIADNREAWLAVIGHGTDGTDPRIDALVATVAEQFVQRTLELNADLIDDTPMTRFALRCFNGFSIEATRAWLRGEQTREAAQALLVGAFRELVRHTIPALQRDA